MSYLSSTSLHGVKTVEIKTITGSIPTTTYAGAQFKITLENGDYIEISTFGVNGFPVKIIQVVKP